MQPQWRNGGFAESGMFILRSSLPPSSIISQIRSETVTSAEPLPSRETRTGLSRGLGPRSIQPMNLTRIAILPVLLFASAAAAETGDYHFDQKGISRDALENYLERSVTMAFYLVPEMPEGRRVYPHHTDDARFIKSIGAKCQALRVRR